jgi:hypothetical protein
MVTKLTMMAHALRYAAQGWSVFPLHSPQNGQCSCGRLDCTSPAKHPRTANGLKDATTDPERIREWWKRWPDANIGVVTGRASGVVVVDVDLDKGGIEVLDRTPGHTWTNRHAYEPYRWRWDAPVVPSPGG